MPLDLLLALLAIALAVNVVLIAGAILALRRSAARRAEREAADRPAPPPPTLPGTLPRDPGGEAWRSRHLQRADEPVVHVPRGPAGLPAGRSQQAADPVAALDVEPAVAGSDGNGELPAPAVQPPRARRAPGGRRATDRVVPPPSGPGPGARTGPKRAGRFTLPENDDGGERTERAIEAFLNGGEQDDPLQSGPAMADFETLVALALEGRTDREMSVVIVELDGLDRVAAVVGPDAATGLAAAVRDVLRRSALSPDHLLELGPTSYQIALPGADGRAASAWVDRGREACQPWLDVLPGSARFVAGWAHRSPRSSVGATVRTAHRRLERDRARPGRGQRPGARGR